MDRALEYIDAFRAATGHRVTVTHMMARAIAAVLEQVPAVNALLRFGRIYRRKRIGVLLPGRDGRSENRQDRSVGRDDPRSRRRRRFVEICEELGNRRFAKVRTGRDSALAKSRGLFKRLPIPAIRPLLDLFVVR